ncbi:hypothetical protein [Hydrogenophaga luteola]|uniref:Uncharacterized protein n=1 Tax=Hydrogenophaga luteola TaxID=1591122 RepID=A0ABV7VZS1_9BURK
MAIYVEDLEYESGSSTWAKVRHGGFLFRALVNGKQSELQRLLGRECLVELGFEKVASWRIVAGFKSEDSCIKASTEVPGGICVMGEVHSVMPINSGAALVDMYLQTGPEFLAIESTELGGTVPSVGMGLEVTLLGLCFYPTNF